MKYQRLGICRQHWEIDPLHWPLALDKSIKVRLLYCLLVALLHPLSAEAEIKHFPSAAQNAVMAVEKATIKGYKLPLLKQKCFRNLRGQ